MITLIVPIYNAPTEVASCVASVFAHTPQPFHLMLCDDASPDPAIGAWLTAIAKRGDARIQIIRHPSNLGFTGNVNDAMRRVLQSGRGDAILLNSDARVTPGWLDAMMRCVQSDARIATATPFSNNAEICSFPKFVDNNPDPGDIEAARIARACAEADVGLYPDLPTGVGFCMFVRAQAWREVGEFDAQTFGRGYGEENDFCQRALKAGWRNVLCPTAYVVHSGNKSFSADKQALVQANAQKLVAKHPNYDRDVQRFIAADPPRRHRALTQSRLSPSDKPTVLHIVHGKSGGVIAHARSLTQTTAGRHVMLTAVADDWRIDDFENKASFELRRMPDEPWRDFLRGVCAQFSVSVIHVHHLITCHAGLSLALVDAPVPFGVTLHDFYFACPAVHLLDAEDRYCGAPVELDTCQRCIDRHPDAARVNVESWRAEHAILLGQAAFVLAPSKFVADTLRQYFPSVSISVVPHAPLPLSVPSVLKPAASPRVNAGWQRFAVVGAIGPLKGARQLERIAELALSSNDPIQCVLIGYTDRQYEPAALFGDRLIVHGSFESGSLKHWLDHYDIELVLFPSIAPETYSYTLSEVWAAGRAVVTTHVGAVAERVHQSGGGWVLTNDAPAKILEEVKSLLSPAQADERRRRGALGLSAVTQPSDSTAKIAALYSEHGVHQSPSLVRFPPMRWYQALGGERADAAVFSAPSMSTHSLAGRFLRRAAGLRHTRWGRALQRRLPVTLRYRLRKMLFGV